MTTLVFSNEDLGYIMKIVKYLEESGLLIKGVIETVKNQVKEQNGAYLGMLAFSLLGNILAGKEVIQTGKGTTRPGQDF